MTSCSTISTASLNSAYDKVASYYFWFAYCNSYNKCDGANRTPQACNTAANRAAIINNVLKPKMASNNTLKQQVANLACNIQLKGNAATIDSQAKSAGKNLVVIMGMSRCSPPLGAGAGGDTGDDISSGGGDPIMDLLGNKNIQIILLILGGVLVASMLIGKRK